jgi:hypothetical protein
MDAFIIGSTAAGTMLQRHSEGFVRIVDGGISNNVVDLVLHLEPRDIVRVNDCAHNFFPGVEICMNGGGRRFSSCRRVHHIQDVICDCSGLSLRRPWKFFERLLVLLELVHQLKRASPVLSHEQLVVLMEFKLPQPENKFMDLWVLLAAPLEECFLAVEALRSVVGDSSGDVFKSKLFQLPPSSMVPDVPVQSVHEVGHEPLPLLGGPDL